MNILPNYRKKSLLASASLGLLFASLTGAPEAPTEQELEAMAKIEAAAQSEKPAYHPFSSAAFPVTGGFTIDTSSRQVVRQAYDYVFGASEEVPMEWTGSAIPADPGDVSADYEAATLLRINFFRAMAGVPAEITFLDEYSEKAQEAALMFSLNDALSHNPPPGWDGYTEDAAEAASASNLSLGRAGPAAVFGQMEDNGANNSSVGHRRWLLYPQTQIMGTGSVDESTVGATRYRAANANWVFDSHFSDLRPEVADPDGLVTWPPRGFIPYQIAFPRWSVSHPGADFSSASVSVTVAGESLPVTLEPVDSGNIGEATLVFVIGDLDPDISGTAFPKPDADTTYQVNVDNVMIAGQTREFSYAVTVFDPTSVPDTEDKPVLNGPITVGRNQSIGYSIEPVPAATGYLVTAYGLASFEQVFDAESDAPAVEAVRTGDYPVIATEPSSDGDLAYHLAQPDPSNQAIYLPGTYVASETASLSFVHGRGVGTPSQIGRLQISLDDGSNWIDLFSSPGTYTGSASLVDPDFENVQLDLAEYRDRPFRLRLLYEYERGSNFGYFSGTASAYGWWVDDLNLNQVQQVASETESEVSNNQDYILNYSASGEILISAQPVLYGAFPAQSAAGLRVTVEGDGSPLPAPVPFGSVFPAAEALADDWAMTEGFGMLYRGSYPWVFFDGRGWVYSTGSQSGEGLWLYHPSMGWLWTRADLFDYVWDNNPGRWLVWRKSPFDDTPAFYDFQSAMWREPGGW